MKLEEAKILYQGERITFRTSEESDNPEGEVALHNKDRRTFDKELWKKGTIPFSLLLPPALRSLGKSQEANYLLTVLDDRVTLYYGGG